jgi:hypothetical protein
MVNKISLLSGQSATQNRKKSAQAGIFDRIKEVFTRSEKRQTTLFDPGRDDNTTMRLFLGQKLGKSFLPKNPPLRYPRLN